MINIELDEKVSEREQASDTDGEKKNKMKWNEERETVLELLLRFKSSCRQNKPPTQFDQII